jgi:hypothetical protein
LVTIHWRLTWIVFIYVRFWGNTPPICPITRPLRMHSEYDCFLGALRVRVSSTPGFDRRLASALQYYPPAPEAIKIQNNLTIYVAGHILA